MSTPKTFGVQSTAELPPLEFNLTDDRGVLVGGGPFRVPRKMRVDLVQMMVAAVTLDGKGGRQYNLDILAHVVREALAKELYVLPPGEWVPVDDRERFDAALASDRINVPIEVLGEIAMWIVEETTKVPTGGPRASSPGPTLTGSTSPGSANSAE